MPFPFQATLQSLIEPLRHVISRGLMLAGIYYAVPVADDETFPGPTDPYLFSSLLIGVGLLISPDVHVPARIRINPQGPRTLLGGMWRDATTGPENRAWALGHVVASLSIVHAMRPVLGDLPMYRFLGSGMNLLTYGVFRVSGHRRYLSHYSDVRGEDFSLQIRDIREWLLNLISMHIAELAVLTMQITNASMLQMRFQPEQGGEIALRQVAQLGVILPVHSIVQLLRQLYYGTSAAVSDCPGVARIRWIPEMTGVWLRTASLRNVGYFPINLVEAMTTDRWHLQDELAYLRGVPLVSPGHLRMLQTLHVGEPPTGVVPGQRMNVEVWVAISNSLARPLPQAIEAPVRPPSTGRLAPVGPVIAPPRADLPVVVIHMGRGDFKGAQAAPPLPGLAVRRPSSAAPALAPFVPGSRPPSPPPHARL